jgi:HlyD family secretion protein
MHRRRYFGLMTLAAALLAALIWGFWPQPVLVEVATVGRAPLQVTVEEEGRTRVKDRYVISAPVAGFLRRIALEVGDALVQDQTVAVLEPLRSEILDPRSRARAEARVDGAQAALKATETRVDAARAQAKFARTEYARNQKLRANHTISQEVLDETETRVLQTAADEQSAQFNVEVARADLEAARTALRYSLADDARTRPVTVDLQAPVASRVLRVNHESEGVVAAGEALIEIGDPDRLEVAVDVLSQDAVRIRPRSRVLFYRWGGDTPLEGVVRTVEPAGFTKISALGVEEQRVWIIADLVSPRDRWRSLGDGYRVEAHFILWQNRDVLQAPASALFHHDDHWTIFVVENGRARLRRVEIGHRNGLVAEIVSGLRAGERVILHPDDRIEDGVRVQVHNVRRAAGVNPR